MTQRCTGFPTPQEAISPLLLDVPDVEGSRAMVPACHSRAPESGNLLSRPRSNCHSTAMAATPTRESQCNVRLALESYWYAAHSGSQRSQCKSIQILLVRRMSNNVVFSCSFFFTCKSYWYAACEAVLNLVYMLFFTGRFLGKGSIQGYFKQYQTIRMNLQQIPVKQVIPAIHQRYPTV